MLNTQGLQPTNEDGADKKDADMKAKIWVLCTVLVDENAPAMPADDRVVTASDHRNAPVACEPSRLSRR